MPPDLLAALVDLPTTAATLDELLDGVRAWGQRGNRQLGAVMATGNYDGSLDRYSKLRVALPPAKIPLECHEIVFEDGAWTATEAFLCDEAPVPRCTIRQVFAKGPPGTPDATRGASFRGSPARWTLHWDGGDTLEKQVYDDDCEPQVERP